MKRNRLQEGGNYSLLVDGFDVKNILTSANPCGCMTNLILNLCENRKLY